MKEPRRVYLVRITEEEKAEMERKKNERKKRRTWRDGDA